jgi:hypothetical protein
MDWRIVGADQRSQEAQLLLPSDQGSGRGALLALAPCLLVSRYLTDTKDRLYGCGYIVAYDGERMGVIAVCVQAPILLS